MEKGPKTAKERMRAYRERLKLEKSKYEEVKQKDSKRKRESYRPVSKLSTPEHRNMKKKWKEGKQRKVKKVTANAENFSTRVISTVPQTPSVISTVPQTPSDNNHAMPSRQRKCTKKYQRYQMAKNVTTLDVKDIPCKEGILKEAHTEEVKTNTSVRRTSRPAFSSRDWMPVDPDLKSASPLSMPKTRKTTSFNPSQLNTTSIFKRLSECKTFSELQNECAYERLRLNDLRGSKRLITDTRLPVDKTAEKFVPKDLPTTKGYCPVQVRADGNCLPACGAVFAFGADVNAELIRLHIIQELVINHDYYLQEKNLLKDYGHRTRKDELLKAFAQYSDHFVPGYKLTPESIRNIYEKEVREICQNKTYMGIWQMLALASVLKMPVVSVYPELGNPGVRRHLHRKITPRIQVSDDEAMILWSSTRSDMSFTHWVPNHFVPLLSSR